MYYHGKDALLRLKAKLGQKTTRRFANSPNVAFIHVPKCGGTSIASAIEQSLYRGYRPQSLPFDGPATAEAGRQTGYTFLEVRRILLAYLLNNSSSKFISGHYPAPLHLVQSQNIKWKFVTILRHPIDRWRSEYVYNRYKSSGWNRTELDLQAYLHSEESRRAANTYLDYFSTEGCPLSDRINEAVENIRNFDVYGRLENISSWKHMFDRTFDTTIRIKNSNVTPNNDASVMMMNDSNLKLYLQELCRPDIEIYDRLFAEGA